MLNVPSQITKVETTSDGGMKLTVHTNELQPSEKSELLQWHNKFGWIVFSPTNEITDENIPDEKIEVEGQKTPSERLHYVLFCLHEAQGGKPEDFEA
jgi:hypothetical protein